MDIPKIYKRLGTREEYIILEGDLNDQLNKYAFCGDFKTVKFLLDCGANADGSLSDGSSFFDKSSSNNEKTNNEKTNNEKTNKEKTNKEKTNKEKTNNEKTNNEPLQHAANGVFDSPLLFHLKTYAETTDIKKKMVNKYYKTIKLLLDRGANPNSIPDSSLFCCARFGYTELVKLFVTHKRFSDRVIYHCLKEANNDGYSEIYDILSNVS